MIQYNIAVIDDEESIREAMEIAFESIYQVTTFSTAEDGIKAMELSGFDLILLDIGLPGMNGIEALAKIKEMHPATVVVMVTAYEDINMVISAMRQGAYDYVLKPLQMDILEKTISNGLETIRLRKEVKILQEKYLAENMPCFIGESNAISDVVDFVSTVAKSKDTPILILGGTGTGKELIAQAVHSRSPNFNGPFVTLNCGAIPENLVESELFGYEKGAFSGASASGKKGMVEEAAGGTLFLDEIGDMSLTAQAKLLRFMENGELYKLGGTRKIKVEVRVVSATNQDLTSMVAEGTFRRDLYYRLAVIKVEVPSLNQRREDIMPIAKHFLVEFSTKHRRDLDGFLSEAVDMLEGFYWDGNVRQLRNMVERGVLVCQGRELSSADLGIISDDMKTPEVAGGNFLPPLTAEGIDFPHVQKRFERHYLKTALDMAAGNESKAATLLNINHHTFRYRLKKIQAKDN